MQTHLMNPTLDIKHTPPKLPIVLVIACWIGTISTIAFIVTPFV